MYHAVVHHIELVAHHAEPVVDGAVLEDAVVDAVLGASMDDHLIYEVAVEIEPVIVSKGLIKLVFVAVIVDKMIMIISDFYYSIIMVYK